MAPYTVYTESTHMSHDYKIANPSLFIYPEKVFTIHRPLFRVPTHEQLGLLSIDVKLDSLRKLTSQLYDKANEDLYILDSSGAVVYAANEAGESQASNETWMNQIVNKPDRSGYMEWDKAEFSGIMVYTKMETPYLNWTMVKRIPFVHLYEYPHRLTLINSLVAVLFLSIAMIAVLTVSLQLTKPLKQFIMHISKIQAGQLEKPIAIDRSDEIGVLAKRFQTMMDTINGLILREYKLKLANKTIQLEMLQAQVNPHFLNNTLQSIGNQALESNAPKVYSLVSSLGQMMHYSMNTKETVVPLSKEIDYVKHYCELQQIRFEDHLHIQFDLLEEADAILIPKMIVQPIVENFFKHGFDSGAERTGCLKVTTLLEEGKLYISVADNGPGIAEERIQAIRQSLSQEEQHGDSYGKNIGLPNIMQRLRLYYGEQAGIELENLEPYGLKVTLSIPLQFAQEEVQA
ncbi:cache domain-containing sensor histidine kinase [Paenibacillus piri]|uniref:histidine kinase n=1 Tax=Paenibacillus piri TaxID=2547395 RepID=A0A4R5KUA0_9BACL|nr:histidine kinase [Paenibacillus piri]TDF99471.1 sensor histidine kinase [Paenibacillus piri]